MNGKFCKNFDVDFDKERTELELKFDAINDNVRNEIQRIVETDKVTLYIEPLGGGTPVAVADITKRPECPDELFEQIKQILMNGATN